MNGPLDQQRDAFLGEVVKAFGIGRRGKLRVLKMHDVRWLSKGQVMVSIVRIMPALLTVLKSEDATLYGYLTNSKVQFLFHFFADVLGELNVLNCNFQEEHLDIASIGGHIKAIMETFRLSFFGDVFAADTCYMEDFLKKVNAQMGMMIFKDNANVVHSHYLHLGPMYEGDVADPRETFDSVNTLMMFICKSYLQSVVHALWNRFSSDLPVFEASKYFSPKDYDSNLEKCDACTKEWLQVLCNHFGKGSKLIIVEKECYLDQAEARDRICRAIQYGSKFISGGMEGVAQQVDLSTGLARKVFRLLKSVNELEALVTRSEKSEHFSLVLLNKSKSCLMATFLALDNLVWAGRIGIFKNKRHTDLISNISLYFLLGAYACGSLAEFGHIVWKKLDERDKDISRVQPYALSVMEKQPYAHVLGFIKSSLDVVVAVGLLQIAPKHVTPRITGACGTVTSLITCYELYRRASLKVKIN
ncbi:hypothetical protein L7F22_053296 [Adiantum nelumboides]|nr:hypothetical protein [Adiantum nelumboides]